MKTLWKDNWEETKQRHLDWWNGKGYVIANWGPLNHGDFRHAPSNHCPPAKSLEQQWTDIDWRVRNMQRQAASMSCPLDTLPSFQPSLGPGSLALYLGSTERFQPETIWYESIIHDPDSLGILRFDPENKWWKFQLELIDRMIDGSGGHCFVGSPDIVENWDVLASLRDAQELLMDMIERPEWVKEKISEINQIWFTVYDALYQKLRTQDGETMFGHFELCAPGKVAKVECDGCAMFSPDMFREFVQPALREQCDWLDYSLYHLDGSQCLDKLDALLEIESLTAIEWTPDPKVPSGGDLHWTELYKRILDAGKRVQVLGAKPEQIEPLIDALGTADGLYFLMCGLSANEWDACEKIRSRLY